ncbi:probable RNA-binding protein EIF1AD [Halyomorpha halys]|uniref:probable RNA-binding protein EIF1AD n=1 Tax=Halyomorpha halys TaxID=286706 RepID=UPI000D0C7FD2|nr:probable RNA-binding protein EIF1AD [Halyomorpha halys]
MTKSTKKKHVVSDILVNEGLVPEDGQKVVRLLCGRGNNLHEVEELGESGERFLVSMPSRYRKTVWVKRGDYLIVQPIEEGDKVKAEITEILTRDRINFLKKQGIWPVKDENEEKSDNEDIPENTNRISAPCESDSSESDD